MDATKILDMLERRRCEAAQTSRSADLSRKECQTMIRELRELKRDADLDIRELDRRIKKLKRRLANGLASTAKAMSATGRLRSDGQVRHNDPDVETPLLEGSRAKAAQFPHAELPLE